MNLTVKILVLFSIYVISKQEEHCTSKDSCGDEDKTGPVRYDEISNIIIKNIDDALRSYIPCPKENCTCHTGVIDKDLLPFKNSGISQSMIHSVSDRGTKYQIVDHKLYRQKECMFPARCSGIEHFIKPLLKKLPNMEMIVNCRDWPQIHKNHLEKSTFGPVFSFSKTDDYLDIMYPSWSFWEGGPAISLYPTGLGRWDKHRYSITEANKKWPWHDKINKAFFRGSRTSDERDSLILLSREMPLLVDAQYTKNQAWKSPKDTLNAEPAKEISLEEHCQYKYLFNFRGVAASFRLKHLFLCKSLVFHVGDEWKEFFYDAMKPWVHYVPIKSHPTKDELKTIIKFFKEHDDLAHSIATKGYRFIWDYLQMKDIQCYWETLLIEYSKLIKYEIELDNKLIEI